MYRNRLTFSLLSFLMSSGLLLASDPLLVDQEIRKVEQSSYEKNPECPKGFLLSNFPAPIVENILNKYKIPKDSWEGIIKALQVKDKEVFKMVEQAASKMTPNPLIDPQKRQEIPKLIRSVIFEIFTSVLKENGIEETSQSQKMLDEIQQERVKKFAECLGKKN